MARIFVAVLSARRLGLTTAIDARRFNPLPAPRLFLRKLQIRDRTLRLHFLQIRARPASTLSCKSAPVSPPHARACILKICPARAEGAHFGSSVSRSETGGMGAKRGG